MKWFGRKGAEVPRPVLARGFGVAAGGGWASSYEGQVREAYLGNAIAQRAVKLVAEGAASAPLYDAAGDSGRDGARVVTPALVEAVAAQLLLHGNAYVQVVADASDAPAELFALRPERVTVEQDGRGWPAAYAYRVGGAVTRLAAVDAAGRPGLIHLRGYHPADDHYGLGCLGAAARAVALHNAATRWNKALLDNAARPSGALVYEAGDGAVLSGAQFDRLRGEIEASFAGAANAGRPMLLDGGLKWQAIGLTPADMDFAGLKAAAAREIALAFGVPPMLLGLPGDATYANYREANRALWRLTILPLMTKVLGGLSAGLAAWWPGTALAVDLDAVPALVEDRQALWAMAKEADFLTRAEKRAMVGFGAEEQG
ncbi:phage portal protein [Sphingomonas sp. ID0503]|uniref:phage portal protein n=1 Tax=Sphingomonas sp. ID0503 TaxID=3399691 RepID=UPI003AFA13ED